MQDSWTNNSFTAYFHLKIRQFKAVWIKQDFRSVTVFSVLLLMEGMQVQLC